MSAGRRGIAVLTLAACTPMLVFAVRVLTTAPTIAPSSDIALIELNVRDVGHHAVLTGPYSRFGWHHLGPALFYVLALPYRLFGSTSASMYAGAAILNACAIGGTVAVVYKHGGRRLALWTLAVLSMYLAVLSPAAFTSPWNPLILLLPFVLVVLLGWALGLGDVAMLPLVAGVGSFLVQSHIGYLGAVGVVTVFGVAFAIARRSISRARWMRAGAIAALVLFVMWLPPVIDQFSSPGGNVGDVASWFTDAHADHTVSEATPIAVREFGALPARLVGATGSVSARSEGGVRSAPWGFGVLTLAASVVAAVAAWRRRGDPQSRAALELVALGLVLAATSVILLARVVGPLYDFITISTSTIGVVLWIGIGAVATQRVHTRTHVFAGIAAAFVLVVALGNTAAALTTNAQSVDLASSDIPAFADAIQAATDEPIVIATPSRNSWPWMSGLVLELETRGEHPKVVDWEYMIGRRRTARGATEPPTILLADPRTAADLLADPANERIAANDNVVVIRRS